MIDAMPFLRLKFADEHGIDKQIDHICSELVEVSDAFYNEPDISRLAEELADLAQSAITGLYIIERTYGIAVLDVIVRVNEKNISRGYAP